MKEYDNMTTDVDAIIAEATQDVAMQPEPTETTEVTEVEQTGDQEVREEKDLSQKTDEELTPEQLAKRERNRESKLSKKLAEFKRQNRELQERLAQVTQPKTEVKAPAGKPDLNTFQGTWEQYQEALTDWKLEQKFADNTRQAQETQSLQQVQNWANERADIIDKRAVEIRTLIPDYDLVVPTDEIDDIANSLTPEQRQVALAADDINLAVYALQKEGRLAEMLNLSPVRLAAEIAKAEMRGQQYLTQPKQTTNAPRPLNAAKGNTTGGKSLERQSVDELMKTYGYR